MRDKALTIVAKYKIGPVFTPPVASKVGGPLATLTLGTASGGTNWPGASYDPETHTVYAYACNACLTPIGLGSVAEGDLGHELHRGHGRAGSRRMRTRTRRERRARDSPLPTADSPPAPACSRPPAAEAVMRR